METTEIVLRVLGCIIIVGVFYYRDVMQSKRIKLLKEALKLSEQLNEHSISTIREFNEKYHILPLVSKKSLKFEEMKQIDNNRVLFDRINKESLTGLANYIYENELYDEEIVEHKDSIDVIHTLKIIQKSK